ncbi:MAG: rod shape-determining protein MreC [candidate division WOR-3 bacterium]
MKRKLILLFALLTIFLNLHNIKRQVNIVLLQTAYLPFIYTRNLVILLQKTEQICSELSKENQLLRESLKAGGVDDLSSKPTSIKVLVGEIQSFSPLGIPEEVLIKVGDKLLQNPESYSVTDLKGNLIGKVKKQSGEVVLAITLYNSNFRAGVENKKPFYTGLLIGGKSPTVVYVPFDAEAKIGDTLFTSRLSSLLQPDIPVGTVSKTVKDSLNPIFIKLYLTPFFKPFTSRLVLLYGG